MPSPGEAGGDPERLSLIWKVSTVGVLGSFLAQLDATVVNVSLSSLAATLHSSLAAVQWVTSGYLLALALTLPLSGWIVGRIGAKALYLWCFSVFTLSSVLCGFAWSANSLIGFRILQGMSAGPLAPMAQMVMARVAGKHMASVFGSETGLLLAPLGLGMMCGYPFVGKWVKRFGNRKVSTAGAALALAGTLPFIEMASHGLVIVLLACALFIRGVGMSAVGVPAVSAAYAAIKSEDLPTATTTLNIVQRIGGPTLTTICASFLGWRLGTTPSHDGMLSAFVAAFILLCVFHGLLIAAAVRLPRSVDGSTAQEDTPARTPGMPAGHEMKSPAKLER
jgi:MFS family permease